MRRLLVPLLGLGLLGGVGACAKVAPNKTPPGAPYPRTYPYEPPGLHKPTSSPDGKARAQVREEGPRHEGSLLH